MVDIITAITLDIHQTGKPATVTVKRGDTGRAIQITLTDGGFPFPFSQDCYAVFTAKKPDGTVLYNNCVIEGWCRKPCITRGTRWNRQMK